MALNITNTTANTLITGTAENDSIINLGDNVTISIVDGDNTILNGSDGGAADNVLISVGGGNNAITIQGGSDKATVITGNGNNIIESTSPNPLYIVGSGNDSLTFYTGSDNGTMIAAEGDDVIRAVGYNVTINAGAGNDTIDTYRNAYYATIKPDVGDDLITFRGNYNLLQYNTGDGNDTLMNYTSNDSIQINGEISSAKLDGENVVLNIEGGTLTITEANEKTINLLDSEGKLTATVFSGSSSEDTLINNTVISGTSGDDYIYNEGSNVTINPGGGDDTVMTFGDKGLITTGDGSNFISVTASENTVIAEEGSSNLVYFSNNKTQGNSKNNYLKFGDGKNSVVTADLYSTVIGGANGDGITLHNGSGGSYIEGNGGSDTIAIGHNDITVYGGEGDDIINLYRDADMAVVNAGKGNDTITVYNNAHAQIYQYVSGDGNDVIRGQRGVEMIPGFDDDDTLQIVGVSSVETVISGDDIIFTFDDGGSITLAKSAENTINVDYQAQWTTVEGGGYKFTSPASFMVNTGSGPKFANFTLSGGNLTDEDGDGKPDSIVIGNVRYIQESGVHTNVNHLSGNVSYNDTLLGVENDDDYGIEAISPIDLSEKWPYNTYITDPNVTAIRGISTNATVSPRGGAGSVTAADWISVDDNSNVVFKDGVYCVYSESYFSSRNYTKLSIANGDKGVSVDTENSDISVIGGLQDGYEITIQSGKNVAEEITFQTDGGSGVIVVQSTANSGKYSLSADSDEFTNQRFTLSGDSEFTFAFGSNGSVTGVDTTGEVLVDVESAAWSKIGENFIYNAVADNDSSKSGTFTVSGSALEDKNIDGVPDGVNVTTVKYLTEEANGGNGLMIALTGLSGTTTINGDDMGVSGDDDYEVHYAGGYLKEIRGISDGATLSNDESLLNEYITDEDVKIHIDKGNFRWLNESNLYQVLPIEVTSNEGLELVASNGKLTAIEGLTAGYNLILSNRTEDYLPATLPSNLDEVTFKTDGNQGTLQLGSSAKMTLSGDDEFTVKFDTAGEFAGLEGFTGSIAGSGELEINGATATLSNTLAPSDIFAAIRSGDITISGTETITDIFGNKHSVKAATNGNVSGDGILVGYGKKATLTGGSGDDVLITKATNSTLTGGAGNDTFMGGAGLVNTTIKDYTEGEDVVFHGQSFNTVSLKNGKVSGNDYTFNVNNRKITVKGGAKKTIKVVDVNGEERYFGNYLTLDDENSVTVTATSNVETIDAALRTTRLNITGNSKDNTIIGGSGRTSMTGGKGADTFIHTTGTDYITDYESGEDIINLGSSTITGYTARGNNSNLILHTNEGDIIIKGGKNKAITLTDSRGRTTTNTYPTVSSGLKYNAALTVITADESYSGDTIDLKDYVTTVKKVNAAKLTTGVEIIGNDNNNSLKGGSGDDTLTAGVGKDTLTGGKGADTFIFTAEGNATITDYQAGEDEIRIEGEITSTRTQGKNIIYRVDDKSLTVKNGRGKDITVTTNTNNFEELFTDENFSTDDLSNIIQNKTTNNAVITKTTETDNVFKVPTNIMTLNKDKNKK